MTVTYCTAQNVVDFLRIKASDGFRLIIDDSNENLTQTDIETLILDAEQLIDEQTHHAFRSTSVSNEMYDFPYARWGYKGYTAPLTYLREKPIKLVHSNIRGPFVEDTDKIEVWEGGEYVDYVAEKTEGRASDWWCDYQLGILYFVASYPSRYRNAVRMTYRYGYEATVPKDIRKACILLVCIDILENNRYSIAVPQGSTGLSVREQIDLWEARVDKILGREDTLLVEW